MAAQLEHKAASVYDMTGVAQKNGTVFSRLRVAAGLATALCGVRWRPTRDPSYKD